MSTFCTFRFFHRIYTPTLRQCSDMGQHKIQGLLPLTSRYSLAWKISPRKFYFYKLHLRCGKVRSRHIKSRMNDIMISPGLFPQIIGFSRDSFFSIQFVVFIYMFTGPIMRNSFHAPQSIRSPLHFRTVRPIYFPSGADIEESLIEGNLLCTVACVIKCRKNMIWQI